MTCLYYQPLELLSDHETPLAKTKKQRKSTKDISAQDSLSTKHLPDWLQPVWKQLNDSLCHYYGAQANPFILDKDDLTKARKSAKRNRDQDSPDTIGGADDEQDLGPGFKVVLQFLIDKLCPTQHHTVETDSQIYRIVSTVIYASFFPHTDGAHIVTQCRQTVYNWRRAFINQAHAAVKKSRDAFVNDTPGCTRTDVADWARRAIGPGGEAHWGDPNPRNVRVISVIPSLPTQPERLTAV